MDTIAEDIIIGKVSTSLASNYNAKQALFSPALADPTSPVTIQMVTNALDWGYSGGAQTNESLRSVANYLIWLCGKFGLQARNLIGIGGASVTPIIPGSLRPSRLDFIVSSTSPLPSGSTGGTFASFIGYNLDFIRGGVSQSTVTTEASYFTWDKTNGLFTCSPALVDTELVALIPV